MNPFIPRDAPVQWIDISRPITEGIPVWPGDAPFRVDQKFESGMVLSAFSTTCHVGSHVDAPKHLDPNAGGVESISLGRFIGPAEVVVAETDGEAVDLDHLPEGWRPVSERVLFRTESFALNTPICGGFSGLSTALVHWLADQGVTLVGIDTPSVDAFESDDLPTHKALAARGMTWIEGLWLGDVRPGMYTLLALPMPLVGVEAAPVRALIHPIDIDG